MDASRHARLAIGAAALVLVAVQTVVAAEAPRRAVARVEAPSDIERKFIGAWQLVRIERRNAKGDVIDVQRDRIGLIMYGPAGQMIVHHQAATRPPFAAADPTGDEAKAALASVTAYFGTYAINEKEGFITHRAQGNVNPAGSGRDEKRFYRFDDDLLILQPPPTVVNGEPQTTYIVWRRVKAS
ncbi:MAG: lipocalin-like domain-containing protein [Vicinamibacterales bacterium]